MSMAELEHIRQALSDHAAQQLQSVAIHNNEITIECAVKHMRELATLLCHDKSFAFISLVDCCGVDYAHYGQSEWATEEASAEGFSRGVDRDGHLQPSNWNKPRFAVVYHLLSIERNQRLRLRVFAEGELPMVESLIDIWPAANWFEREAFDLYGILFKGHPDLRRILTDYGFIGHPFRKDFPVSGHVEMRYDAKQQRVIYEPVDIRPRVLVPKVIREDNRYVEPEAPVKLEEVSHV